MKAMPQPVNLTKIGSKIKINLDQVRDRIPPNLIKQIEIKEERLFELELADQEDAGIIADTEVVTSELATLKAKLAELEG